MAAVKPSFMHIIKECRNKNHWLGVTLEGKSGPSSAIGARVVLHIEDERRVFINQWTTTYLTSSDPRLHIGLGNTGKIELLEIHWSDGTREYFPGPEIDRYLTIRQGSGHKNMIDVPTD